MDQILRIQSGSKNGQKWPKYPLPLGPGGRGRGQNFEFLKFFGIFGIFGDRLVSFPWKTPIHHQIFPKGGVQKKGGGGHGGSKKWGSGGPSGSKKTNGAYSLDVKFSQKNRKISENFRKFPKIFENFRKISKKIEKLGLSGGVRGGVIFRGTPTFFGNFPAIF